MCVCVCVCVCTLQPVVQRCTHRLNERATSSAVHTTVSLRRHQRPGWTAQAPLGSAHLCGSSNRLYSRGTTGCRVKTASCECAQVIDRRHAMLQISTMCRPALACGNPLTTMYASPIVSTYRPTHDDDDNTHVRQRSTRTTGHLLRCMYV